MVGSRVDEQREDFQQIACDAFVNVEELGSNHV